MVSKEKTVSFLLRIGLAFSFAYVGITAFLQPYLWQGFFPPWATRFIPENIFMPSFAVYQLLIALWLLSNKKPFYAAVITGLTLVGIIVTNFSAMEIIFRDITILTGALALAVLTRKDPARVS